MVLPDRLVVSRQVPLVARTVRLSDLTSVNLDIRLYAPEYRVPISREFLEFEEQGRDLCRVANHYRSRDVELIRGALEDHGVPFGIRGDFTIRNKMFAIVASHGDDAGLTGKLDRGEPSGPSSCSC